MASYNKVVKSKLSFKGNKASSGMKKLKPVTSNSGSVAESTSASSSSSASSAVAEGELQILSGTGRITTSGKYFMVTVLKQQLIVYICDILVPVCE